MSLLEVRTETARFEFDSATSKVHLWQLVDSAGQPHVRLVGTLTFTLPIGPLTQVNLANGDKSIESPSLTFRVSADASLIVHHRPAYSQTHTLSYRFPDATWAREANSNRTRQYSDPFGGLVRQEDNTADYYIYGVLPSRVQKRSLLYGSAARPHHVSIQSAASLAAAIDTANPRLTDWQTRNFGVIELFEPLYTNGPTPVVVGGQQVYQFTDEASVISLITRAHALGFLVIAYILPNNFDNRTSTLFTWMDTFQSTYNLDGWYFDGFGFGAWLDNYRAAREAASRYSYNFAHVSVDPWGSTNGIIAAPLLSWMDGTLQGETGALAEAITSPNDPFIYASTRFTGCKAAWKRATAGTPNVTAAQIQADMAAYGIVRTEFSDTLATVYDTNFAPVYNAARSAWQATHISDPNS